MIQKTSLLSRHSKSFYWAGFFLPKQVYKNCSNLYDFCRSLDDIADQNISLKIKKKQFQNFKFNFIKKNNSIIAIRNMSKILRQENISHKIIYDLFDGIETDLKNKVKFMNKKSLLLYSYRVAGTVGLIMAKILKVRRKSSLKGAIDLGIAMQLTNIARDVIEDKKMGRFYIPHNFKSIKKTIKMADHFYTSSFASIKDIPISCRFSILVARRVYRQIGNEILKKKNLNDYNRSKKIYVSNAKKLVQTALSILDFIELLFTRLKKKSPINWYFIAGKKINLYERI